MAIPLRQSTAVTVAIGPFVGDDNGNDEETGLTIAQADVRLKKNGGDAAQKNNASSCTHDEDGVYDCPLSTTDTNTLGLLVLWVHVTGALIVRHDFEVMPANVWDSLYGSDLLDVNISQFGGTNGTFSSGRPEVNTTHADGTAWNSGAIGASTLASDTITAAKIASDAITAAKIASDAITAAKIAADALTAAKFAADVTTELQSGLATSAALATVAGYIDTEVATLIARLGAFTGSGDNTVLGVLRALARKDAALPSDIGGTFDPADDSLEALKDDQMTAQDLEDAVWEAAKADHNTADTMGEALQDAGGAGTPPTVEEIRAEMDTNSTKLAAILEDTGTTLPATLSSMDGKLDTIDNFLDTEIASIISSLSTIAGYLDTEIAAILADTNELQTDWANGGRLDLLIDAIKAVTDALPNAGALSSLAQDSTVAKEATLTSTGRGDPSALAGAIGSISLAAKVDWIFASIMRAGSFNKTTGEQKIKNSAGTDIAKATAADDGTTTSRGAYGAP